MEDKGFADGRLVYEAGLMEEAGDALDFSAWHNGFLAFSSGEKRLAALSEMNAKELLDGGVEGVEGVKGYLMEVDLWRQENGVYEELVLEREDNGFYRQYWKLFTAGAEQENDGALLCYYREAAARVRESIGGAGIFSDEDLRPQEVICPALRLHFFITTRGGE